MESYITNRSEISVDFVYPDKDNKIFFELGNLVKIDIDPLELEINLVKKIAGYVHALFRHDGNNKPSLLNPITVIREAKLGKSFRCVEYSFLVMSICWAYNIPARIIGLKTKDVETRKTYAGHVVVEFWSKEYEKWIMVDVQIGIIPRYKEEYLSAVELGEMIYKNLNINYELIDGSRFSESTRKDAYAEWIKQYLYFFDTALRIKLSISEEERLQEKKLMLIPLKSIPPKLFQRTIPIHALYTHSVLDFYPKIKSLF